MDFYSEKFFVSTLFSMKDEMETFQVKEGFYERIALYKRKLEEMEYSLKQ